MSAWLGQEAPADQPVGREQARQDVVDAVDVVGDALARQRARQPVQAGTRGGAQALHVDRMAHHARRDVHDPANHGGHAVKHRGTSPPARAGCPRSPSPPQIVEALELTGRGTARVVEQDVGRRQAAATRRGPCGAGDVGAPRSPRPCLARGAPRAVCSSGPAVRAFCASARPRPPAPRRGRGPVPCWPRGGEHRPCRPEVPAFAPLQHRSKSVACFK